MSSSKCKQAALEPNVHIKYANAEGNDIFLLIFMRNKTL